MSLASVGILRADLPTASDRDAYAVTVPCPPPNRQLDREEETPAWHRTLDGARL
jgi:hypothetical protein